MPNLVLEFTKMQGAGNDFIVLDNRFYRFSVQQLSKIAKTYCKRRVSVGADGLLALNPPEKEGQHFRMFYFNADGSLGSMCGNGARCIARFAFDAGINASPLVFGTDAGNYTAVVRESSVIPVKLFMPTFQDYTPNCLKTQKGENVSYMFTGTQHAVVFVSDVANYPVAEEGFYLRWHEDLQPKGANVNFVEVVSDIEGEAVLKVRTFEKGVEAETLACGTGALASAFTAYLEGKIMATHVKVVMQGGVLEVGFTPSGDELKEAFQAASVSTVYRGTLELPEGFLTV